MSGPVGPDALSGSGTGRTARQVAGPRHAADAGRRGRDFPAPTSRRTIPVFPGTARCRGARCAPGSATQLFATANHPAGVRQQSGNRIEQRGLARPVQPDHGDEFPFADMDRHVVELGLAVVDAHSQPPVADLALEAGFRAGPRFRCCRRDRPVERSRCASPRRRALTTPSPRYIARTRSTRAATLLTLWSTSSTACPSSRKLPISAENRADFGERQAQRTARRPAPPWDRARSPWRVPAAAGRRTAGSAAADHHGTVRRVRRSLRPAVRALSVDSINRCLAAAPP